MGQGENNAKILIGQWILILVHRLPCVKILFLYTDYDVVKKLFLPVHLETISQVVPTLLPKRKATSEKLRFFWGRV